MSSSRFHTINTACVHTQSCIPSHTSEETTPTQHYTKIRFDCNTSHATQDKNKDYNKYNTTKKSSLYLLLHGSSERRPDPRLQQKTKKIKTERKDKINQKTASGYLKKLVIERKN